MAAKSIRHHEHRAGRSQFMANEIRRYTIIMDANNLASDISNNEMIFIIGSMTPYI